LLWRVKEGFESGYNSILVKTEYLNYIKGLNINEINERIKELQDAGIMEKVALATHPKLLQMEKAQKEDSVKQVQEKRSRFCFWNRYNSWLSRRDHR